MRDVNFYLGYCDNPFSLTKNLFPNHFFLCEQGGFLNKKKSCPDLNLVECQFQLINEIPESNLSFKKYVEKLNCGGVEVISHAPFMIDKNVKGERYIPLCFNFSWVVVPKQYERIPIKIINNQYINAFEIDLTLLLNFIELLSSSGISVMTLHVTTCGCFLSDSYWKIYLEKIFLLKKRGDSCGVNVIIETGGLLDRQMDELINCGFYLNFDIAHYFLDRIALGDDVVRASINTSNRFFEVRDFVKVVHLSQTYKEYDSHLRVYDSRGDMLCINDILHSISNMSKKPYLIFETLPDDGDFMKTHELLTK